MKRHARIRAARNRAAPLYATHDPVPKALYDLTLEHLVGVRLEPSWILDLSSDVRHGAEALRKLYRRASVVHLDIADAHLRLAAGRLPWRRPNRACADARQLPFKAASFALIFSSMSLTLTDSFPETLKELARVAAPGALLVFSTLGPDSFAELRAAWSAVDAHPHVPQFMDMHDIGDALVQARFADVVMDTTRLTVEYPSLDALLKELRALGHTNVMDERPRGLTTPRHLRRLEDAYARSATGSYPVTLEIAFAHAWAPMPTPGRSVHVDLPTHT